MNEPLDNLIRTWANRHTPDVQRLARLERRIAAGARREVKCREPQVLFGRVFATPRRVVWLGLGAAGVVLCILMLNRPAAPVNGGAEKLARVPEASVRSISRLFNEAALLFGDRLHWIAQSGQQVELGVDEEGTRPNERRPMAVHIAIVSRSSGTGEWKKVWDADVIARTEELIEVMPDAQAGNRLVFWLFPLGDNAVAVDSRLRLKMPLDLSSDESAVVREGIRTKVMEATEGSTEYRVFQMVEPLRNDGKAS